MYKNNKVKNIALITLFLSSHTALAGPIITDITRVGLIDDEHTHKYGRQESTLRLRFVPWQGFGQSTLYEGTSEVGESTWQSLGGDVYRLGLTGREYTRSDGRQYSLAFTSNTSGDVIGMSLRYKDNEPNGQRVPWKSVNGVTTRLGFTDSEHTSSSGNQFSRVNALNEAGTVIGSSTQYNGDTAYGSTAWKLTASGEITRLGLFDQEHTSSTGAQSNAAIELNESGDIIGASSRYDGDRYLGNSIWQFKNGTTARLGFFDDAFTSSDGIRFSEVSEQNEAGVVIGRSRRYLSRDTSFIAWQSANGVTTALGLYDDEHTSDRGSQYSLARHINEAGFVAGNSGRFNGNREAGISAWQVANGKTIRLGFTDSEHTRDNGQQYSTVVTQNEAGDVLGYSKRYDNGRRPPGRSVWQATNGIHTRLGLVDEEHTHADGTQYSIATRQNQSGDVVGYSNRYIPNQRVFQYEGHTAWYWDKDSNQHYVFDLSENTDTGFTVSEFMYLGDDGLALGTYRLFDTDNNYLGIRAMGFTVEDGFFDLGSILDTALDDLDLSKIYEAFGNNRDNEIVFEGSRLAGGTAVYRARIDLTHTKVTEPATLPLIGFGLLILIRLRRTTKN